MGVLQCSLGLVCLCSPWGRGQQPPSELRCFPARASRQQGSLWECEVIPGFGIPFQNVEFLKPYHSQGCMRRTTSFIYCHTSLIAFIKLEAEIISIFYLPKSSRRPLWFSFPMFFQSCQQKAKIISPVTPEVPVQGLLSAKRLFKYSSEINGEWISVM